jgi:OmcA/MtrC family decaheme c-type cytochrome
MFRIDAPGTGTLLVALALVSMASLTGCDGDDGAPGAPGPPAGVDIGSAGEINAVIDRVTIASPPVVDFSLTDAAGNPVKNLPAGAISFQIAKLVPGTNGNASFWQSYINQEEFPRPGDPGDQPGRRYIQATSENGAAGTLVDNQDGTYRYTFSFDINNVTTPIPVAYQPTLTHRVTFEIRGFAPVRNPYYDFRPSDNATTGLFTREISKTGTCNVCHENLAEHGGARFEMQECVVCHNPGSADANSGNTVDMTVMTHKIHYGVDLPTIVNGAVGDRYSIIGRSEHIYSINTAPMTTEGVVYPQDISNCRGCHDENDSDTPDASNWFMVPTDAACGSCHDDVNFVDGTNHGDPPPLPADNSQCLSCHLVNDPNDPNYPDDVRQAHRLLAVEASADYEFVIDKVIFAGAGTAPTVEFYVRNPGDDSKYDLDAAPLKGSGLRFYVAWNTIDYFNVDYNDLPNGPDNSQPVATDVYDGSDNLLASEIGTTRIYTLPLNTVPASVTGSGVVTFEGYVDDPTVINGKTVGKVPVTSTVSYFMITDPNAPVPRRTSVDIDRCNDCHALTSFHGTRRNDSIEACQVCHVPDAWGQFSSNLPMDMKHFIHRIHAVDPIRYPQRTSNCLACHTDDGFFPVSGGSGVLATSTTPGADIKDPTDNLRTSANTAACGSCHIHSSPDAQAHMAEPNGSGSTRACQDINGNLTTRLPPWLCTDPPALPVVEDCVVCHGEGRSADTARAHKLDL